MSDNRPRSRCRECRAIIIALFPVVCDKCCGSGGVREAHRLNTPWAHRGTFADMERGA